MWLEGTEEDHAGVFSHLVRGPNGDLVPDGAQGSGAKTMAAGNAVGDENSRHVAASAGRSGSVAAQGREDVGEDAEGEPDLMEELQFVSNTEDVGATGWL